jgi:hypothetical protein
MTYLVLIVLWIAGTAVAVLRGAQSGGRALSWTALLACIGWIAGTIVSGGGDVPSLSAPQSIRPGLRTTLLSFSFLMLLCVGLIFLIGAACGFHGLTQQVILAALATSIVGWFIAVLSKYRSGKIVGISLFAASVVLNTVLMLVASSPGDCL